MLPAARSLPGNPGQLLLRPNQARKRGGIHNGLGYPRTAGAGQEAYELSEPMDRNIPEIDMRLAAVNVGVEVFLEEPLDAANGACFRLGYGKVPAGVPDERMEIRALDGWQWCL